MRIRKVFCLIFACITLTCCFSIIAHAAQIEEPTAVASALRASGKFDMSVPGNTILKANSDFPLEAGETVRIKASYSPDGSVDFGLIDSDGVFHFINVTNGTIDRTIRIEDRGTYTLAVRNNASKEISVSGFVTY